VNSLAVMGNDFYYYKKEIKNEFGEDLYKNGIKIREKVSTRIFENDIYINFNDNLNRKLQCIKNNVCIEISDNVSNFYVQDGLIIYYGKNGTDKKDLYINKDGKSIKVDSEIDCWRNIIPIK
jgi:hypothetical protein